MTGKYKPHITGCSAETFLNMENGKISCKGTGKPGTECPYDRPWFCKCPYCASPVITSTLLNTRPNWCPITDSWNNRANTQS